MTIAVIKKLLRMCVGGLLGHLFYCLLIMLKELPVLIHKGYYDWEGVIYQWPLPLAIFFPSVWTDGPRWTSVEGLFGDALVIAGLWIGATRKPGRKAPPATAVKE